MLLIIKLWIQAIINCRIFGRTLIELGDIMDIGPLSSPKEKHKNMKNSIDFLKLDEEKHGKINFNNMIPILDK